MATTYKSPSCTAATARPARAGIGPEWVYDVFEASVALVIDDIIQMVPVPLGATVLEVILSVDDLDSGAALVLDVGDGDDDDRYILGSTIGQTGGTVRLGSGIAANGANCQAYEYTAEDTIDIHVDTAPAGGGTGTLRLAVCYTMQQ